SGFCNGADKSRPGRWREKWRRGPYRPHAIWNHQRGWSGDAVHYLQRTDRHSQEITRPDKPARRGGHMKERKSVSITRDPRVDPQRGDEVRCGGLLRRVIRREGEMLWCR